MNNAHELLLTLLRKRQRFFRQEITGRYFEIIRKYIYVPDIILSSVVDTFNIADKRLLNAQDICNILLRQFPFVS